MVTIVLFVIASIALWWAGMVVLLITGGTIAWIDSMFRRRPRDPDLWKFLLGGLVLFVAITLAGMLVFPS